MTDDQIANIACDPPTPSGLGDVWYCPDCARKWNYTLFTDEDEMMRVEAWFTSEIG